LGFIGNGFTRKGGDLLLRVHQEHFADRAHLTLVCGDAPKESAGLRNVRLRCDVPWGRVDVDGAAGLRPVRLSDPLRLLALRRDRGDDGRAAGDLDQGRGDPGDGARRRDGLPDRGDREAALVERMDWALANRAALPAMGARGRERAADHYAAERTYPELLDLLASYTAGRS
jgi:hypothetical protein